MEILEIPEERRSIIEPPITELATEEAHVKTTVAENAMPPEIAVEDVTGRKANFSLASTVEVSSADTAAAEALP